MQIQKLWVLLYHRNSSMFDRIYQRDRHLHWQDCLHGAHVSSWHILLLPHARRITQHRDRTRHGNSAFPFHFAFRIGSCIFSFEAHISSWSRTRDTTLIRGLNHGWNRIIVTFLYLWESNSTRCQLLSGSSFESSSPFLSLRRLLLKEQCSRHFPQHHPLSSWVARTIHFVLSRCDSSFFL